MLNPFFNQTTEKLKYTDEATHGNYSAIYETVLAAAKWDIEQFKFGVVVYDEIEHFPKDVRNTRFTYPFIDQKTVVNKIAVRYDGDQVLQQVLNLKRSTVCLEPSILSGLDLITHGKAAFA